MNAYMIKLRIYVMNSKTNYEILLIVTVSINGTVKICNIQKGPLPQVLSILLSEKKLLSF